MPFVTEEIYQKIPHIEESIMISSWPEAIEEFDNEAAINDFGKSTGHIIRRWIPLPAFEFGMLPNIFLE